MELRFKRYVAMSEKNVSEIAKSIGQSRQNCEHWIKRDTNVFVTVSDHLGKFDKIIEVFRRERIYPAKVAKTTKKIKRQVKRR